MGFVCQDRAFGTAPPQLLLGTVVTLMQIAKLWIHIPHLAPTVIACPLIVTFI